MDEPANRTNHDDEHHPAGAGRGGLSQALGFLTPIGGAAAPSARALPWFPLVGALVGVAVGTAWWGASHWWPPIVAAALVLIVDLVCTGMLHVDGLADSADGLLPPLPRERRLEVMRDPRAGAFGVIAVVAILLLRFAVFASITPTAKSILTVAAIWSTSRALMAVTVTVVPYARARGLASAFLGGGTVLIVALAVPIAVALALLGAEPHSRGLLAIAGCAIGGALVVAFGRGRVGGFTGDIVGAAGVFGETVALVILAVHA